MKQYNGKAKFAWMIWSVAWLSLVVLAQGACAKELVLVKDGKPNATLVLSVRARQPAKLAAAEFQRCLERITGTRLPEVTDDKPVSGVRVLVGESRATRALGVGNETLLYEEYCVRTGPDTLLLAGHDEDAYGELTYEKDGTYPGFQWYHEQGTLWAVLDFLERECGVRWYLPGDIGEVIKPAKILSVGPVDVKRQPWARHRWIVPRPFPQRLYHYMTLGCEKGPITPEQLASWKEVNLWWLHQRIHDEPAPFSHNDGGLYQECAKTHPEYFAQLEPNKPICTNVLPGTQLAFHKPEVAAAMAKKVSAYFDLPLEERRKLSWGGCSPNMYAVSPLDNANYCQSPEGKAKLNGPMPKTFWNGWASRLVWDFVNETARQVAKKHPDKWISCFAYWCYTTPYPGMTLEPNVAVQFCRSLMTEWDPVQRDEFAKALAAWEKLAPERFYLYEYFCFPQLGQNNIFPGWAPHRVAEDLKHLKSIGLRGAYNDIACESVKGSQMKDGIWVPYAWANPTLDMVNFYVWLKYLDDQGRSVDELLDEMYASFYGPAGKSIQKFVALGEKLYWDKTFYRDLIKEGKGHLDDKTSWTVMCPPERLKEFGRLIEEAKAAAQSPEQKKRVQIFDEGVYQMMKTSSALYHQSGGTLLRIDGGNSYHILERYGGGVRYSVLPVGYLYSGPISNGWHHIMATHDVANGGKMELFVDGVSRAVQSNYLATSCSNGAVWIGGYYNSAGNALKTAVDEVRVSSVVRNAKDAYTNQPPVSDGGTTLLLHLDSDFGKAAFYGPPPVFVNGRCGKAAEFSGTNALLVPASGFNDKAGTLEAWLYIKSLFD